MSDNFKAGKRIDVEESKRLGRLVTKEVDENDPDYYKYKQAGTIKVEGDDFHIDGGFDDNSDPTPPKGIELYYFYMYLIVFFIPISFIVLKAFIVGGDLDFVWKMFFFVGFVLLYVIAIFAFPIYILKRDDVSITHRKRMKVLMGNNLVLLIWLTVFVVTPMMANITIPISKAKLAFILFFALFIFDVGIQWFMLNVKENHPNKIELCERLSLVLSIATIWGYGAIICPLIFSKTIERVIFDIALLGVVTIISTVNMLIYKLKKKTIDIDYEYTNQDYYGARKALICLVAEGLVMALICIIIICV